MLHQSGGGYTDDEFQKLLEKTDIDGYLVEKLVHDPISFDPVHKDKAVLINKQVYDVNSIFKTIQNGIDFDPLTKLSLNLTNLVDIRNKLDNEVDRKNIYNLILSKLQEKVKNILLKLNEKQLDILFTVTKINILYEYFMDIYNIDELFSKYNYLLNNDITDKSIIDAVKTNYNTFLLVPEEKMSDVIIKLAVETNGTALKYVPEDKKTNKICELAVKQDGNALGYVVADKMTDEQYLEICELAVKLNGCALKYVYKNKISKEAYLKICNIATDQNGFALKHVDNKILDNDEFNNISKKVMKDNLERLKQGIKNPICD